MFGSLAIGIALLGGCASTKEKAKQDKPIAEQARLPAYFEQIPVESLFFVGGSEAIPESLVVSTLEALDFLFGLYEIFAPDSYNSLKTEAIDVETGVASDAQDTSTAQGASTGLLGYLRDEMGGELSAKGLARIGVSSSPHVAAYAVGFLPVLRVELSDSAKFSAFLDRLDARLGLSSTGQNFQNKPYRVYRRPMGQRIMVDEHLLVRVSDREVVMALSTKEALKMFLPYFMGVKTPAKNMATDNRVGRIAANYGFKPYATAYFDFEKAIAWGSDLTELEDGMPGISARVFATVPGPLDDQAPVCRAEFERVLKIVPRAVGGIRHYDKTSIDIAAGVALEPEIARQFNKTISGVPGSDTTMAQQAFLEAGLGIHVGAFIDALDTQARSIQAQPFECDDLSAINWAAERVRVAAGQLPPAVRGIAGFVLLANGMRVKWPSDESLEARTMVRALAALRSDNPQALVQLLGMFMTVPEAVANLKPDGHAVELPEITGVTEESPLVPFVLMTPRGIAWALGADMAEPTRELLAATPAETAPAMLLRANLGDPVRRLLADLDKMVDQAEAQAPARGLSAQDIAGARAALNAMRSQVSDGPLVSSLSTEISPAGLLFSFQRHGHFRFDVDVLNKSDKNGEFDALDRVLGQPKTPEE